MTPLPINFIISPRRRLIRTLLISIGFATIVSGFLGAPDAGGDRTLWIIDNSLSMAVEDISTGSGTMISRLDLAKHIVLSGSSQRVGEQAIMTAAYGARLELPMVSNMANLSDVVRGITPLARGGGSTVVTPLEMVRLIYGNSSHLSVIWITDGEFSDSGSTLSGSIAPVDVTFIGVGTRSGGPILEGYDSEGRPRYKQSGGVRVNSHRDDATLSQVADSLDARLILLQSDDIPDLSHIAKNPNSNTIPPYTTILGLLLVIVGLIFPRFRYTSPVSPGK